jgi:hypothetical protein
VIATLPDTLRLCLKYAALVLLTVGFLGVCFALAVVTGNLLNLLPFSN